MSFIKKVTRKILSNLPAPVRRYTVEVVNLAPNELLKGRTALITGGTSGIGFHIARAYLNSGAYVIITGRNIERINNAVNDLSDKGLLSDKIYGLVMDVTNVDSFEVTFKEAQDAVMKLGGTKIDILVNNAGVSGVAMPNETEEKFDSVINTNLKGSFFLSQLFGKYCKENKIEGNILNIASSSALRPANSAYTISKWGVRGLTLGLAKSLAPYNITVNGLAPGPTATPMLNKASDDDISLQKSPIGRYALPEEIANMAVVLVSSMGRTIVGDIVYMTGGAGLITFDDVEYRF